MDIKLPSIVSSLHKKNIILDLHGAIHRHTVATLQNEKEGKGLKDMKLKRKTSYDINGDRLNLTLLN